MSEIGNATGEMIKWNAYLLYLKDWVNEHLDYKNKGLSPLTYEEWLAFTDKSLQEDYMPNNYQKAKEKARNEAIDWQADFANHNYSYGELAFFSDYFEKKAKCYGLIKEFRENAII